VESLNQQLATASGESRFVVAVFIDVRGFSRFAGIAESVEAAMFLKKFYSAVLDNYYADATFAKPTGDGLMLILEYEEADLGPRSTAAVSNALRLMSDYPKFLRGDPMITFDVPPHIGAGIARGAATRLSSEHGIIDYSGRALNLAARLMDLARPKGLVLDAAVGPGVVEHFDTLGFSGEKVYLRGITDATPHRVYLRPEWTRLTDASKRPAIEYEWFHEDWETIRLTELRNRGYFSFQLAQAPAFPDEIVARVRHPAVGPRGKRLPDTYSEVGLDGEYVDDRGQPCYVASLDETADTLEQVGVKRTWDIDIVISYRIVKGEP
jgi:class 3 adenylate cyclase